MSQNPDFQVTSAKKNPKSQTEPQSDDGSRSLLRCELQFLVRFSFGGPPEDNVKLGLDGLTKLEPSLAS